MRKFGLHKPQKGPWRPGRGRRYRAERTRRYTCRDGHIIYTYNSGKCPCGKACWLILTRMPQP